jgi:hypothetical protein
MTAFIVDTVPLGTAAFLVVACCLVLRMPDPTSARVRIPAQPGPRDAAPSWHLNPNSTPDPGAAP